MEELELAEDRSLVQGKRLGPARGDGEGALPLAPQFRVGCQRLRGLGKLQAQRLALRLQPDANILPADILQSGQKISTPALECLPPVAALHGGFQQRCVHLQGAWRQHHAAVVFHQRCCPAQCAPQFRQRLAYRAAGARLVVPGPEEVGEPGAAYRVAGAGEKGKHAEKLAASRQKRHAVDGQPDASQRLQGVHAKRPRGKRLAPV